MSIRSSAPRMMSPQLGIILLMICLPAILRLVGMPANFAPIGALALFIGAHLRQKSIAILVPILAMFLSDIALGIINNDAGYYTWHTLMPVVYLCFAFYVCLGFGIRTFWRSRNVASPDALKSHKALLRGVPVVCGALLGAIIFFIVTNGAYWAIFNSYPHTVSGLIACYDAGIPFFRNMISSDLIFSGVLFLGYDLISLALRLPQTTSRFVYND